MNRPLRLIAIAAVLAGAGGVGVAPAWGQPRTLQLDGGRPARLPVDYLRQRLDDVQRQAQSLRRRGDTLDAEGPQAIAHASSLALHALTERMLRFCVANRSAAAVPVAVAAVTLGNRLSSLDARLQALALRADGRDPDAADPAAIAAAQLALESLRPLAGLDPNALDDPTLSDPRRWRPALHRWLSPTLAAMATMGQSPPANPWRVVAEGPPPTPADLFAAANLRLRGLPGTSPLSAPLATLLDRLEPTIAEPLYAARLDALLAGVQAGPDLMERLDAAAWLEKGTRDALAAELVEALGHAAAPATRAAAMNRLASLRDLGECIHVLTAARRSNAALSAFDALVVTAARDGKNDPGLARRTAMTDWLRRALDLHQQRAAATRAVPPDLQDIAATLNREGAAAEKSVQATARDLAGNPGLLDTPAATASLSGLRDQVQWLQVLAEAGAARDVMRKATPRVAGPLGKRLRALAEQLAKDRGGPAGLELRQIAEFGRLTAPMPGEAELRQAVADGQTPAYLSDPRQAQQLLRVIDTARETWAQSLGTMQTPQDAGRSLTALAIALRTAADARLLLGDDVIRQLNRWPALELDGDALRQRAQASGDRARLRIEQVVSESGEAAMGNLQAEQVEDALVSALAATARRLGPHLSQLPDDDAAGLGQVLFSPPPGSWAEATAADLGWVNWGLWEGGGADRPRRPEIGRLATEAAQRVMQTP